MAERVQVREIDDDESRRLLRINRRGIGSVVTWRRAQMVLLSAQGMPLAKIAEVSFSSDDRVRDVIHNFNTDGFDSLYGTYAPSSTGRTLPDAAPAGNPGTAAAFPGVPGRCRAPAWLHDHRS
ncbi:helix-turn-helix domain-containing protein [Streptomyces phaeochromogenes]|uniref:Helix-turn-helix domain-containing protein n=1 Tax=Streptomyces phaeochromogenes TaxID=1923 RepID=A0ABZ1HQK3_STRPH|nr:helix-turn-helix domain-containing protein [Streptomyces phaeochromogenes]